MVAGSGDEYPFDHGQTSPPLRPLLAKLNPGVDSGAGARCRLLRGHRAAIVVAPVGRVRGYPAVSKRRRGSSLTRCHPTCAQAISDETAAGMGRGPCRCAPRDSTAAGRL